MRFSPDKCMSCGHPPKRHKLTIAGELWCCDSACYQECWVKYLDKRYALDKSPSDGPDGKEFLEKLCDDIEDRGLTSSDDDPELKQRVKTFKDNWYSRQRAAIADAKKKFDSRAQAEWDHYEQEREKKEAEAHEKQRAKDEQREREDEERERQEDERRELLEPKPIPPATWFSGTWIVSPPGRGKTELLKRMVVDAINGENPGAIVLMDGKGDLINAFRNLDFLKDYLIVIDPRNPISINPLDVPKTNITRSVDFLEYLFGALLEFKMTPMQQTLFRSVFRAMVTAFPNPNLSTLRDLLVNGTGKYRQYIEKLDDELKDFFQNDFDKLYLERRREVIQRLRLLLENETVRSMLTAPHTRFKLGDVLDYPHVIIINNSQHILGEWGAEFFGRFFISQLWAAATARSSMKPENKLPVHFFMDESQLVIKRDERIAKILDECRSQKIAMVLAHQRVEQIESQNVLSALKNCAIRITNSDDDAKALAENFRTTPEFLRSLNVGEFAVFVRDVTRKHPFVWKVRPVDFSSHPEMTPANQRELMQEMTRRYGVETQTAPERAVSVEASRDKEIRSAEADTKTITRRNPSARSKW